MATGDPPQLCGKLELGATFGQFVSLILGDSWTINLQFGAVIYICIYIAGGVAGGGGCKIPRGLSG